MTRTSVWFAGLAIVLAACAQADGPGSNVGPHDGGGIDARFDVNPGTDTGKPPGDDTAPPDEDSGTGTKDTPGGSDTGSDTGTCTIPTGKKCGTIPQCGCAGKNCDVTKVDGTRACVAAGTSGLHDKCTSIGQCGAGLSCIAGNCLPFCDGSTGCPSGTCTSIQGGTPPADIPDYKVCFEDCDPAQPSLVCGAGNCGFNGATDTVCTSAGTGTGAGGCSTTAPFGCAAGYVCLTTNACAKWCRMDVSSDCTGGKLCSPLSSAPTKGGHTYGVCQ